MPFPSWLTDGVAFEEIGLATSAGRTMIVVHAVLQTAGGGLNAVYVHILSGTSNKCYFDRGSTHKQCIHKLTYCCVSLGHCLAVVDISKLNAS